MTAGGVVCGVRDPVPDGEDRQPCLFVSTCRLDTRVPPELDAKADGPFGR